MTRSLISVAFLGLVALVGPDQEARAQPYAGGLLVANHIYGVHKMCDGVLRLVANNRVTTLLSWACYGSAVSHLTMDRTNRKVLAITDYTAGMTELDLLTQAKRQIPFPKPFYLSNGCIPGQSGGLVAVAWDTNYQPHLIEVDASYTTVTTIRANLPPAVYLADRDLATGGYVILDQQRALVQVLSPTGKTLSTILPAAAAVDVAQNHLDGSYYVATSWRIYRVSGKVVTSLSPPRAYSSTLRFDRGTGRGALVAVEAPNQLATIIHRLSPSGGTVSTLQPSPYGHITDVCFARDRNLATEHRTSPNHWRFLISFPGEAGRQYALGLSATGFTPGLSVAGRLIPLVPDPLFFLSATGKLPYLTNAAGTLDAQAEASANLDLRPLGAALGGLRLWAAALTLDANAPSGIATISKPVVLVLE